MPRMHPILTRMLVLVLTAALMAAGVSAQVTLGPGTGTGMLPVSIADVASPSTWVDLRQPASATGSIDRIRFRWSEACAGAVNVSILRRHGNRLSVVATVGPFDTAANREVNVISLAPAVEVRQGDLIALTKLTPCGLPVTDLEPPPLGPPPRSAAFFRSAAAAAADLQNAELLYLPLAISATGPASEHLASVVPVVASAPGAFGAQFLTTLQLHNPWPTPVSGRLVFRPAGHAASASDPSLAFTLGVAETRFFSDIVGALGAVGAGSIDVIAAPSPQATPLAAPSPQATPLAGRHVEPLTTPTPFPQRLAPVALARVFDARSTARAGFTQRAVSVDSTSREVSALARRARGVLLTPEDLVNFRMNVGVRTLFDGAEILIAVRDASGASLRSFRREYVPSYFEQSTVVAFADGPVPENGSIEITILQGSAIVYGSTVDNRSNDASLDLVREMYLAH